ncbi:NADH:flavin oxidoreductase [Phenylobacterium sp.]|uniref:NADH:flavin oxidoreductase n=1 Tax=Phenylobacterium sp. TaxID=1871053 RepID=UPI0025E23277|nr:NADH:flavin oxidoreductase [Phenylobacterium sp.]
MTIAKLFDPVRLGDLKLRNRTVMAPMTRRFSPGGTPGADVAGYYLRRAEGGVGAVMTEGLEIDHPASVYDPAIPNFFRPEALAAWSAIASQVQAAGAAFIPQFWHVGGFRSTLPAPSNPDAGAMSPSGVYAPGQPYGSPASDEDIAAVIDAYGRAARAGFEMRCDGIEIHGAHGYLIDQFLWAATNLRSDPFGGDLSGRIRFARDIVAECRRQTAPGFPIFFRFSQWKLQDYAARPFAAPADLQAFLAPLVDAGVDVFDCSTRRFWQPEFDGSDLNLAGWTRKLSGKPVMTVGSVGLDNDVVASMRGGAIATGAAALDELGRRLDRGDFDLVGIGRSLLADPQWVNKVRAGDLGALRGFNMADLEVLT